MKSGPALISKKTGKALYEMKVIKSSAHLYQEARRSGVKTSVHHSIDKSVQNGHSSEMIKQPTATQA